MKTTIQEQNQPNAQPNFSQRCIDSCRKLLAQIQNVKAQVVTEFRDQLGAHQRVLELAVNEAEALAWQTDFPELVFPTLAVEKARSAVGWHVRQQSLRYHAGSPALMAA